MAKRVKQLEFSDIGFGDFSFRKPGISFGGGLLTSNPKIKRPLESKFAIHVTLRSTRSGMRNPSKFGKISKILGIAAKKYGIKIYDFVNVGNHLHLILKLSHIRFWAPFIREVTSKIAYLMKDSIQFVHRKNESTQLTHEKKNFSKNNKLKPDLNSTGNSEKNTELNEPEKFWKYRPHTRIIKGWKKAFRVAKQYLDLNRAEAEGFINRKEIKTLKDLRALFADG